MEPAAIFKLTKFPDEAESGTEREEKENVFEVPCAEPESGDFNWFNLFMLENPSFSILESNEEIT